MYIKNDFIGVHGSWNSSNDLLITKNISEMLRLKAIDLKSLYQHHDFCFILCIHAVYIRLHKCEVKYLIHDLLFSFPSKLYTEASIVNFNRWMMYWNSNSEQMWPRG